MPTLNSDQLYQVAFRVLTGAGVSDDEAQVVADELQEANLVGHDSHGIMRLMQYAEHIEQGFIKHGSDFEIVKDAPSFLVADGHFNFGQVSARKALDLGIEKARAVGTATVMVRNCNHVGRLGSYSQKAAKSGIGSMMAVNAPGPGGVAPYGGMERRLGTNPISMSAPWGDDAFVLDMTTSATAEGKLRVAHQKGESVPEGMIIDKDGNPTTDPGDYYEGGTLLPLGGPLAFKGYGMSVMIDLFAGAMSGSGLCRTDLPRGANGVWMYLVDVNQFIDDSEYSPLIDTYVDAIKGTKKLPGVNEILMPGEIEQRRRAGRVESGVAIPDETWRQINELAGKLDVDLSDIG